MRVPTLLCLATILAGALPGAELATKKALTLEIARNVAAAGEEFARKNGWKVAIAIVDEGGYLIYFERMDGAPLSAVDLANRKARTAAIFGRPSKAYNERIQQGETGVVAIPGVLPFEGGLPIVFEGQVLGGIGVSGVTSQQDGMVAQAGVDAFARMVRK
jgi:uncharacterized protein GlcG (DUF336 family)